MQMNNASDFYCKESGYEKKGIFGRHGRSIFQSAAFPIVSREKKFFLLSP